jgi:hypothetical protein
MKGIGDTVEVGEWRGWNEVWLTFNSKKVLNSITLMPKAPISLEEAKRLVNQELGSASNRSATVPRPRSTTTVT